MKKKDKAFSFGLVLFEYNFNLRQNYELEMK